MNNDVPVNHASKDKDSVTGETTLAQYQSAPVSSDDELTRFLEELTPADFSRVLNRIPGVSGYIPQGVSHFERVADLLKLVQSSNGIGPERLRQIIKGLFPSFPT